MKKYGEIARFKVDNITYVIHTTKIQNKYRNSSEAFVPFLSFYRTIKSAKYSGCDKRDKYHIACSLEGKVFNQVIINTLINKIKQYLVENDVKLFSFAVFGDNTYEETKRLRFYDKVLGMFGYRKVFQNTVEEEDCYPIELYYYEKEDL